MSMTLTASFSDVRANVIQRMHDFNIVERSINKNASAHTRISSAKPSSRHTVQSEDNLDLQILQDSFNSLFTSTLLFDQ